MGYSFEDFFDEYVVPKMKEIFEDPDFAHGDEANLEISDRFLGVLRSCIQQQNRGEDFAKRLLTVATNEYEEDMSPDQFVRKCFNLRYDELELRKLEYAATDGTIVSVNFRGELEEQELEEKIANRIADKKTGHF